MDINIKLSQANGRLDTRNPFIIANNDALTLTFNANIKYDYLLLTMQNNGSKWQYKINKEFEVPIELLNAGLLEMQVTAIVNGNSIKQWAIEPITIKEINCGFEGHTEFETIIAQQAELQNTLNKLIQLVAKNQVKTNDAITAVAQKIDDMRIL